MIALIDWKRRHWSFDLAPGAYPAVVERLRGTPARADALIVGADETLLRTRVDEHWSVNEHLGHLDDLHDLDLRRLHEYLSGAAVLSAADPENRATSAAHHNDTPPREIAARFRRHREALVRELETVAASDITAAAMHPRLHHSLRLIDWAQFVADHDDHHLASARRVLATLRGGAA